MERIMINVEKFLIINTTQFDNLIYDLNLSLSASSDVYLLTLIIVNIFAYLLIYWFIKLIVKIDRLIFGRKRRLI